MRAYYFNTVFVFKLLVVAELVDEKYINMLLKQLGPDFSNMFYVIKVTRQKIIT